MRIGVFGNTNNYPLLLVLALRRLGHHAVLVVNRKELLHRPEARYPTLARGYPDWIMDCSHLGEEEFIAATPHIGEVINFLACNSDGLLLNDLGPSLLEFCSLPAVAVTTGSDLMHYADPGTVALRQHGWADDYRRSPAGRLWTRTWEAFIARQRAGILAADAVAASLPGLVPAADALLQDIGVPDDRREFFYMADLEGGPPRQARPTSRLRIVNGARLNWKKPLPAGFSSQDHKATDVLLEGFADFVTAGGDAELVLFRKGLHVAETEALAQALGIADRILWREEVGLREFYAEIAQADIVCDNLGDSFPGLVALQAMAAALPVIANFQPRFTAPHFPQAIPACQASTPAEVAGHLTTLAGSARARATTGLASRRFVRKYCSPAVAAEACVRRLTRRSAPQIRKVS